MPSSSGRAVLSANPDEPARMAFKQEIDWIDGRPSPQDLLDDPAVSNELKLVLRSWLLRDPCKAATESELLCGALTRHADEVLAAALKPENHPPQL